MAPDHRVFIVVQLALIAVPLFMIAVVAAMRWLG
jgi:hypothetical protein